MSGGHFDYQQYRLNDLADQVQAHILRCTSDETDEYGYKPTMSPEGLVCLCTCRDTLRKAGNMLHSVDWCISGDTDEDTMIREFKEMDVTE
jgi:hypothetical protein